MSVVTELTVSGTQCTESSVTLMAHSHWPEPRPERGLGTNRLYELVWKLSHYTWTRMGPRPFVPIVLAQVPVPVLVPVRSAQCEDPMRRWYQPGAVTVWCSCGCDASLPVGGFVTRSAGLNGVLPWEPVRRWVRTVNKNQNVFIRNLCNLQTALKHKASIRHHFT